MVQSGLLVPAHPESTFGIFKQLMIHIGDTQSIEFELSTYSAHLKNMKYFMEEANGRTMFLLMSWEAEAIRVLVVHSQKYFSNNY